jgi:hypothetical protein
MSQEAVAVYVDRARTVLMLPRRRRQLSAFDFEIAPASAFPQGPSGLAILKPRKPKDA